MSKTISIHPIMGKTIQFLKTMFKQRSYPIHTLEIAAISSKLIELRIQDEYQNNVMAIILEPSGTSSEIVPLICNANPFLEEPPLKLGLPFVNDMLQCAQINNIRRLILVCNVMTPFADKRLRSATEVSNHHRIIERWTHSATGRTVANHMNQPVSIKLIVGKDRVDYVEKNPMFRNFLKRYSTEDPLIKSRGFLKDDLLIIIEHPTQCPEYAIVVEDV